jgi:DNA modification methylase
MTGGGYLGALPLDGRSFEFGGQRLLVGDARALAGVPDGAADLIVTSPPYWNLKKYGAPGEIGRSTYEEYLADLALVWAACFRCASPDAVLVINVNSRRHKGRFYPIAFDVASRMEGWKLWDHIVWYVPNALPQPNHYRERLLDNKFESCLVFTKGGPDGYTFHKPRVPQKYAAADRRERNKNPKGRCVGNVIRIPAWRPQNVKEFGYHIAALPEELAAFFIECYTDPGGVVLDPFVGSGTTLKVCGAMGRRGIGVEANPDFVELIQRRIDEDWSAPAWTDIDLIHSASSSTVSAKPRKAQFLRPPPGTAADARPAAKELRGQATRPLGRKPRRRIRKALAARTRRVRSASRPEA